VTGWVCLTALMPRDQGNAVRRWVGFAAMKLSGREAVGLAGNNAATIPLAAAVWILLGRNAARMKRQGPNTTQADGLDG
jgi:hypothetical protein